MKDNYVFPSDKLAVEEEYVPSEGTYLENHEIRAAVFGDPFLDREHYKATVFPRTQKARVPHVGEVVVGVVQQVRKVSLAMEVHFLGEIEVYPPYSGVLHVSNASRDFVSSMDELFASGDIVRAKVVDAKTVPIQLETKGINLGVIYSLCERCGSVTNKVGRDKLQCSHCEHFQRRKTAIDYGKGILID